LGHQQQQQQQQKRAPSLRAAGTESKATKHTQLSEQIHAAAIMKSFFH